MKFEWCYELEEVVEGAFYDHDENELKDDDLFVVLNRDLDGEGNQYFEVKCERTGEVYDVPASLLDKYVLKNELN